MLVTDSLVVRTICGVDCRWKGVDAQEAGLCASSVYILEVFRSKGRGVLASSLPLWLSG